MPPRPHRPSPRQRLRCALWLGACVLALVPAALARADDGPGAPPAPPAKAKREPAPKARPDPRLIGEYALTVEQVVDGDTIRLPDGRGAIRILGLDTEELPRPRKKGATGAPPWVQPGFEKYAEAQRGDSKRPVKYGTPAGEAASAYLKTLVKGCTTMRLERDFVGQRERGTYGRVLAHVFLVPKEGGDVNVTEALIRAGHSPYFVKYGRSRRFDERYREAQEEARKAKRGIWGAAPPHHYPDYPERLRWWNERADQLERWEKKSAGKADHVTLGTPGADAKLLALAGKQATVFGALERELPVKSGDKRIFLLGHERRRGFALVVFDAAVAKALDEMERFHSMYVTVCGKVTLYKGRPQMVIEKVTQVTTE